jgi:hypothetical protein
MPEAPSALEPENSIAAFTGIPEAATDMKAASMDGLKKKILF